VKRALCVDDMHGLHKHHIYPKTSHQLTRAEVHHFMHRNFPLILASGSTTRSKLLRNAGVFHDVIPSRFDEDSVKNSLLSEKASPRDIADTLAEQKARKVSNKHPDNLVLGCDQVLDHKGTLVSKPETQNDAVKQLRLMRNDRHMLLSAAVIVHDGKPIWRHIGQVRLQMRDLSDEYIDDYVARNWESIRHSVGSYKLEEEGARLFTQVNGDYFNVLGLPLLELLSYLTLRGDLKS